MDQSSGSRNDKLAHAPSSSYVSQINNNAHLANNLSTANIGKICSASNQSCLPPPPDYYETQMVNFFVPGTSKSLLDIDSFNETISLKKKFIKIPSTSALFINEDNIDIKHKYPELKYLCKWSVNVKRIKLEQDDTSLIIELNGTLLSGNRLKILDLNHNAGIVNSLVTKSIVETNNGTYHLIGPIAKGYPNNLYRACLQTNGIPKTWKYTLTQFTGKRNINPDIIKRDSIINLILHQVLMKGFRLVETLMEITVRKLKEYGKARKPIPFMRYHFHKKLIFGLETINEKMIKNLKPVVDEN